MYISAWLRMPKRFTSQERYQRIDTLLHDLGLWKCRDTRVGGGMVKGISGGERKRLSVGVELITDPGIYSQSIMLAYMVAGKWNFLFLVYHVWQGWVLRTNFSGDMFSH